MNSFLEERKANGAGAFDMISGGEATALVRDLSDDTLEPITFDTKEGERLGLPKGTVAAVISEGAGAYRKCSSILSLKRAASDYLSS